ncbi:esterase/lipase family protein [Streptomyces sp. NPDC006365]|uniref:esterase/lipase family protein n=1 Tax=Streptomyces sp. NPDC006365 TaxID=3364744 RepID=UPI00369184F2
MTRAAEPTPVPPGIDNFPQAFLNSFSRPDADPPGAKDWDCEPTARHPRPVVLIHGTFENAFNNWNELSPKLRNEGYCVFAINQGAPRGEVIKGRNHIPDSAVELAGFVDRVLRVTGADQVDLVGHSQGGGVLPRWYLKFNGGAAKVNHLVGISPSNHGTTMLGLATLAKTIGVLGWVGKLGGQALPDQVVGSDVHTRLDRGGDTIPGVTYTTIVTRFDEVVTPYTNQYLTAGPGAKVTNILLQDVCRQDLTDHIGSSYDPIVHQLVLNALDTSRAVEPGCYPVPPVIS